MKKRIFLYILWILFLCGCTPIGASAFSSLLFDAPTDIAGPGSEIGVFVRIKSDVPINAFDIEIAYPSDELGLVRFSDVESIVDVWQERPFIANEGVLKMSGGMIEPFKGDGAILGLLHFRVLDHISEEKIVSLSFLHARFYQADGAATAIIPQNNPLTLTLSPQSGTFMLVYEPDPSGPEILVQKTHLLDSEKTIFFLDIKDAESGIEKMEVRFLKWFSWSSWQLLSDHLITQKDQWVIQIRSTNNAGIQELKTIYVWENLALPAALIFGISLLLGMWYNKRRRCKEKKV